VAQDRLDERGHVEVDDVVLDAPGLDGEVSVERAGAGGAVRGARARKLLDDALTRVEMRTDREIVIAQPRERREVGRGTRGGSNVADGGTVMTLTVPGPPQGHEQVVLSIDEHGVATWHLKGGRRGGRAVRGGRTTRTYTIERTTAAARGTGRTRGLVPGLDKVIRVITFPVASAVGRGARFAAREWDSKRHPPQIRAYGATGRLTDLDERAWSSLAKGPALLFVHGTFSTTEGGFGRLVPAARKELHRRYDGRVIAYDHPTIADDPIENARKFLETVAERTLKLDIVCHSRGGLVSRAIAERPGDLAGLAPRVKVRSVVHVGVPNSGTILAKAEHWNELLDRVTTLINLVPAPGIVDTLETVLAVVRSIAVETAKNLEGLDAMAPGSRFLGRLNMRSAGRISYRAIVSDFEPKNPGLKAWLNDAVRDALFGNLPNDMMVTIESMTGKNGSNRFPISDIRAFKPADGIEHANYFPEKFTQSALFDWLLG
jgi:pimeloyl-ACP methyl ester carboxylesterase